MQYCLAFWVPIFRTWDLLEIFSVGWSGMNGGLRLERLDVFQLNRDAIIEQPFAGRGIRSHRITISQRIWRRKLRPLWVPFEYLTCVFFLVGGSFFLPCCALPFAEVTKVNPQSNTCSHYPLQVCTLHMPRKTNKWSWVLDLRSSILVSLFRLAQTLGSGKRGSFVRSRSTCNPRSLPRRPTTYFLISIAGYRDIDGPKCLSLWA